MNKKGAVAGIWLWVVLGLLVGYFLNIGGMGDIVNNAIKPSATPTPTGTGVSGCYLEGATLTIGNSQEWLNPDVAIAAGNETHRVFLNDNHMGLYADGSTLGVNPPHGIPGTTNYVAGDKVTMYWAENSTGYYAAKQEFEIPCADAVVASQQKDSNTYQLFSLDAATPTFVVTNPDGTLNTGPTNYSVAMGAQPTFDIEIQGAYRKAISPFGKLLVVCQGNKSVMDDLIFAGDGIVENNVPDRPDIVGVGATNLSRAAVIKSIKSTEKVNFQITLDSDDTVEIVPATTPDSIQGAIGCYLVDQDYFRNSITGVETLGYQTDQMADVGIGEVAQGMTFTIMTR